MKEKDQYLEALNAATEGSIFWKHEGGGYTSQIPIHTMADALVKVLQDAAQETSLDPQRIKVYALSGIGGNITRQEITPEDRQRLTKPAHQFYTEIVVPEEYGCNTGFVEAVAKRNEELLRVRREVSGSFVGLLMDKIRKSHKDKEGNWVN